MRKTKALTLMMALIGQVCWLQAGITGWDVQDDGDGAVTCDPTVGSSYIESDLGSDYHLLLEISAAQCRAPGHIQGTVLTDTAEDPILTLVTSVANDTTFAWTAYQVNVSMNNPFTLFDEQVTTPLGWSATVTQPQETAPSSGEWAGSILFAGGAPIQVQETLAFQYSMFFEGKTSYAFTQEMIPVPEPSAFGAIAGALLLAGVVCRRRR